MIPERYSRHYLPLLLVFAVVLWAMYSWQPSESTDLAKPRAAPPPVDAATDHYATPAPRSAQESVGARLPLDAPFGAAVEILRQRMVRFDPVPLKTAVRALQAKETSEPVALKLFDDTTLNVRVTRGTIAGEDRFVLSGRIESELHSQVVFAGRGGFVHGFISSSEGTFSIEPTGTDGTHAISEKILTGDRACGTVDSFGVAAGDGAPAFVDHVPETQVHTASVSAPSLEGGPNPPVAAATFSEAELITIDVMVLYTTAAKVRWAFNLDSAMLAKIDALIEQANDVFERSGTRARVRLVHTAEIDLAEEQEQVKNVENISGMESIQQLRDEHGADLVFTLLRNEPAADSDHVSGQLTDANIEHVDYGRASAENEILDVWSVAQYTNVLEWFNLVHCLGHCLGCAHDREATQNTGAFEYSRGHKFEANGEPKLTIMATGPGTRLTPYFSNPDLIFETSGVALGVPAGQANEADNRRTINEVVFEVSQHRLQRIIGGEAQRLTNVSTRGWVGDDSALMIGGFVLSGSGPQDILIRAQGPSLAQYGVEGALADPRITFHSGADRIADNDDWQDNPAEMVAAITNSGFEPGHPLDSALFLKLDPGSYTCVLGGIGETTTGVGIIEVFRLDSGEPRVVNLSTRGFVDSGDNSMIAGIVIEGTPSETRRVLIGVVGPALSQYGVEGVLVDPNLKLFDAAGNLLFVNEDWIFNSSYMQQELEFEGLAPEDPVEPAIIVDLKPGAYTAIVTPFTDEDDAPIPGVALVEAYEILE